MLTSKTLRRMRTPLVPFGIAYADWRGRYPMNLDAIEQFKQVQKRGCVQFVPFEAIPTPAAAKLVRHAGVQAGQHVLDVACGTGVVAITAARVGAQVAALDLTPELLERARENAQLAEVKVE